MIPLDTIIDFRHRIERTMLRVKGTKKLGTATDDTKISTDFMLEKDGEGYVITIRKVEE